MPRPGAGAGAPGGFRSCSAPPRPRWKPCTTPSPAATACCDESARGRRAHRACCAWMSKACRWSGIGGPLQQAIRLTLEPASKCWCSSTAAASPLRCCHDCGWLSECPRCDARMTVHQRSGVLRCHHCGYDERRTPVPAVRPSTCARSVRAPNARLKVLFPDYPILRVDRQHGAQGRHAPAVQYHPERPAEHSCRYPDAAKGHHFPRVTLVAILDAGAFLGRLPRQRAHGATDRAGRRACWACRRTGQGHHPDPPGRSPAAGATDRTRLLRFLCRTGPGRTPCRRAAALLAPGLAALRSARRGRLKVFWTRPAPPPSAWSPNSGCQASSCWARFRPHGRAGRFRAQLLIQANTRAPLHRLISAWLLVLEQMPSGRQVR